MIKVLFVCLGNICRSPTAEIIFQKLVQEEGLEDRISVDSAGTAGYHIGEMADQRTRNAAKLAGYDIIHRARQFNPVHDFKAFDCIVAMDDSNYKDLIRTARNSENAKKVHKFSSFLTEHNYDEVPDPYYGGDADFRLVIELCEDGAQGLLQHIYENFPQTRPTPNP